MPAEPEWLVTARAKGLIVREGPRPVPAEPAAAPRAGRDRPELVEADFTLTDAGPVWVVPLHVVAGDNTRGIRGKIGRAGHERRAVSRALGGKTLLHLAPLAHAAALGMPVTVTLTKLGGQALDTDNLSAAMKYVRDAVACKLGFDDGPKSPLRWRYGQEPGGPHGVRIALTVGEVTE